MNKSNNNNNEKVFLKIFGKCPRNIFFPNFSFGQVAGPVPTIALIITDLFLKTLQKFSKQLLSGTTFSDTSYYSKSEHYVQRTLRKDI